MSEKYKFRDPVATYFTTTTIVGWIDVFTRTELKQIVIDSLRYCQQQKDLRIHGWCLMSSHLHLLCSGGRIPLSPVFSDFKSHTSKEIVKCIDTVFESRREWMLKLFRDAGEPLRRSSEYKVWQDGNHPIICDKRQYWIRNLSTFIITLLQKG